MAATKCLNIQHDGIYLDKETGTTWYLGSFPLLAVNGQF